MLVGTRLRRLREAQGITPDRAGAAIKASHAKISRVELGWTSIQPGDVDDLLTLYGLEAESERATLLALVRQANTPDWWEGYRDVVPAWFEAYLRLESLASRIRSYDVEFVPGLLQTPEYARATIRHCHPDADEAQIQRRVSLRLARQHVLRSPDAPRLWAVIDEAALYGGFGGVAVMREQLRHLIHLAESSGRITLQMLPLSAGGHRAVGGPFNVFRLPEPALPDVVYLQRQTTAAYPASRADIGQYRHIMNSLVVQAEPPRQTLAVLREILGRYRTRP